RFRVDETRILPRFVLRILNSPICKDQIIASAKRAVAQSSVNQGDLRALLILVPPLHVQQQILDVVEAAVYKLQLIEENIRILSELFHTLLHQLMTAQSRVADLDLSELATTAAAAA